MPVHKDDWEGLGRVTQIAKEKYGVSVAADESCRGFADVKKIVEENLADIINIKLSKLGVVGAHEIIELAHASGLHLMISGIFETRISMGFASHLAAGLGCFKFIDLDAPNHLSEDPVVEGCVVYGPVYKFPNARGSPCFLDWDKISWLPRGRIKDKFNGSGFLVDWVLCSARKQGFLVFLSKSGPCILLRLVHRCGDELEPKVLKLTCNQDVWTSDKRQRLF
ncbi:hypothetical protein ACET3Z_011541 [Daucus carota]